MPDKHGFNHLGDDVRCIDCPTGGPLGRWPEHKRAQHARTHDRTTSTNNTRRARLLLAAPPTATHEEKEATMPTTPTKDASAKRVAIDVLRQAGEPLPAKEIAKRVLASGRCAGLRGKTPEATISAMLAVGSKPGGPFTRVDKGTYTLADATSTASKPAQQKPATTAKPKSAAGRSTAQRATAKRSRYTRLAPRLRGQERELSARLHQDTRRHTWVNAVVVIWGHFPTGQAHHQNITYIHGDKLADWLTSQRPQRLRAVNPTH